MGTQEVNEYLDTKVKCEQCLWQGTYRECRFGHNDYCCPHCQVESLVEVKIDPGQAGNAMTALLLCIIVFVCAFGITILIQNLFP